MFYFNWTKGTVLIVVEGKTLSFKRKNTDTPTEFNRFNSLKWLLIESEIKWTLGKIVSERKRVKIVAWQIEDKSNEQRWLGLFVVVVAAVTVVVVKSVISERFESKDD